jgi:transposase
MNYLPSSSSYYICCGVTDMRKGAYGLSIVCESLLSGSAPNALVVIFRGRNIRHIKCLWWDGQGYCLLSKYLEQGKHHWISDESSGYAKISQVQLSQLLEGGEWRISKRVLAPELAV